MADLILIQVTKEELRELIQSSMAEFLRENNSQSKSSEIDPLIKINEVCGILRISKVTVHKWKKSGRLPFHRISNRIFFKKSEILDSLKKIEASKTKGGRQP